MPTSYQPLLNKAPYGDDSTLENDIQTFILDAYQKTDFSPLKPTEQFLQWRKRVLNTGNVKHEDWTVLNKMLGKKVMKLPTGETLSEFRQICLLIAVHLKARQLNSMEHLIRFPKAVYLPESSDTTQHIV